MTFLMIHQMIPDCLQVYRFDDPDKEMTSLLRVCNGHYLNSSTPVPEEVENFLSDLPQDKLIYDDTDPNAGILKVGEGCEIIFCGTL